MSLLSTATVSESPTREYTTDELALLAAMEADDKGTTGGIADGDDIDPALTESNEQIAAALDVIAEQMGEPAPDGVVTTYPDPMACSDCEPKESAEFVARLEAVRPELYSPNLGDPFVVTESAPVVLADAVNTISLVVTATLVNESLRNVRATFDAKKKRGTAFKGARSRLDRLADDAVRNFGAMHFPDLTATQVHNISKGDAEVVGDSSVGFDYVDFTDGEE